jgi:hypothetical protein
MRRFLLAALALSLLVAVTLPGRAEEDAAQVKVDAVLRAVDEIEDEVARIRGLPWKRRVEAEVLTRAQLKEKLEEWFRDDVDFEALERDVRSLRRFGMLREDEDLLGLVKSFFGEGILAYYDTETRKIYVVLGPPLDALRPTICHELVHALEDQYVDIDGVKEGVEDDSDRSFALACVVEGSAERGRALWEIAHPELARRARAADSPSADGMKEILKTVPAFVILPTSFNYQRGITFVTRATGHDYPGGMARLYEDPPTTQEQILHPGRYGRLGDRSARDLPRRIVWDAEAIASAAGRGWAAIDDERSGELDTALWWDYFLGACKGRLDPELLKRGKWCAEAARVAAEGWDGDRTMFLRKEGMPLAIVSASAWDRPLDAREAGAATLATLRARYGDRFATTGWAYAGQTRPDGTYADDVLRTADYVADGQKGRLQVRGDVLFWLEAVPGESFERVFEALTRAWFERDRADRWAPERQIDPLEGTTWRATDGQVGWRAPGPEWVLESAGSARMTARKGAVTMDLSLHGQDVASALPAGLRARIRNGQVEPENTSVHGRLAARMAYDGGAAVDGRTTRNVILLVELPWERVLLFWARATVGAEGGPDPDVEIEQAIDGIVVPDE